MILATLVVLFVDERQVNVNSGSLYEKLTIISLAIILAISSIYSYKLISFAVPCMAFIIIKFEKGFKNFSLKLFPPFTFLLILLFWIGMSIFWAENQVAALKALIALIFTFLSSYYFICSLLEATPSLITRTYSILKMAGLLLIILIICQICFDTIFLDSINFKTFKKGAPYMLRMKPTGSIMALLAFVGCAFLWIYENKILSIFMFCLLLLLIKLTLCQTAFYAILLSIVVFILAYLRPFYITRMGIICSYTFAILSPIIYTYIYTPTMVANSPYFKWILNHSLFHRYLAWEYYSKKFFENPILGWGLESSRYIATEPELAPGFISLLHPHNGSIQAYAELGIIGGVLYALSFSSLYYLVEKHVKDRLSIAVCNATITFGFVSAEITHNLWRNYWLSFLALTAGLIILFIKAREAQQLEKAYHLKPVLNH